MGHFPRRRAAGMLRENGGWSIFKNQEKIMAKRTGLGKGLDALIPAGQTPAAGGEGSMAQVSVEAISPNPRQPRVNFDADELDELAASIREHGVIQPLIVSPPINGKYTLIAG